MAESNKAVFSPFSGYFKGISENNEKLKKMSSKQNALPKSERLFINNPNKEASFRRDRFLVSEPVSRQIDFESIQAINLSEANKTVRISDKSLSDLLQITTLNNATGLYEVVETDLNDAKLTYKQKLEAVANAVKQNKIINENDKNLIKNTLVNVLEISNKSNTELTNLSESMDSVVKAIEKLKIPRGNHVSAGLPKRFYNAKEYADSEGVLNLYIISQLGRNPKIPVYSSLENIYNAKDGGTINLGTINVLLKNKNFSLDIDAMSIVPTSVAEEYKRLGRAEENPGIPGGVPVGSTADTIDDADIPPLEESWRTVGPMGQIESYKLDPKNFIDDEKIMNDLIEYSKNLKKSDVKKPFGYSEFTKDAINLDDEISLVDQAKEVRFNRLKQYTDKSKEDLNATFEEDAKKYLYNVYAALIKNDDKFLNSKKIELYGFKQDKDKYVKLMNTLAADYFERNPSKAPKKLTKKEEEKLYKFIPGDISEKANLLYNSFIKTGKAQDDQYGFGKRVPKKKSLVRTLQTQALGAMYM